MLIDACLAAAPAAPRPLPCIAAFNVAVFNKAGDAVAPAAVPAFIAAVVAPFSRTGTAAGVAPIPAALAPNPPNKAPCSAPCKRF